MTGASGPTCFELSERVLQIVSPNEVSSLGRVWDAYERDPLPTRSGRGVDRLLGSGIPVDQMVAWAHIVVPFLVQMVATVAVEESVRGLIGRWGARKRARREISRVRAAPVGDFDKERLRVVYDEALRTFVLAGRSETEARLVAQAVVGALALSSTEGGSGAGEMPAGSDR